jgi:hypothetical protein
VKGLGPLTDLIGNGSYVGTAGTTGQVAFAANVGTTQLIAADLFTAGQYRVEVAIVATALATLAANCVVNVLGHDAAGAYTSAMPLDSGLSGTIAGSFNLGTTNRASGALVVQHDGSTDLSFAITGISTPGPLAAKYQVTLTRIG